MVKHEQAPNDPELDGAGWQLRVTDLKQYAYCPRVVHYEYCMPRLRPVTYKMTAGIAEQTRVTELEERRSLRAYGLSRGERRYHVPVQSASMRCTGQIDMVIETDEGGEHRLIPVDFKLSRQKLGHHFRLQLACYGMMLEEQTGLAVPAGYLYRIPLRHAERVEFTQRLRAEVGKKINEIRTMIIAQRMPPPTANRARCTDCEFRRFCNDVL